MRLQIIFFALQHSAGIFFGVDGVEKVGIPLLLLATLAAVLLNSNRGSILAFVQFNSTAKQMRSVAKQPICNAFISYIVMPFTLTYVPRTVTGYTVYIYVNC